MNDTKKRILDVALDLFAQHGFSSVSIRDICKAVQIKESSVYYHFKSKQAIFDELLDLFEKKATDLMCQLDHALAGQSLTMEGNFYQKVSDAFFEHYFMDDFCNKIMRLLLIEQFRSNSVRQMFDYWMFDKPLEYQSKIFSVLIDKKIIPPADSYYLAVKYYAPIYLFAQRWLFNGILTEEKKNFFRTDVNTHVNKFFQEIGVK